MDGGSNRFPRIQLDGFIGGGHDWMVLSGAMVR